jgi:hypothetical protein
MSPKATVFIRMRLLTQNIYKGVVEAGLAHDSKRYQTTNNIELLDVMFV